MTITIGADPELFVSKDQRFVSAHGLVPGTKKEPFKVQKGAVQVDGLALEFNIDPASSYEEFQENLDTVSSQLKSMVPDYQFLQRTTVRLTKGYRKTLPLEAVQIGCNSDVNAYTESLNEAPSASSNFRSAGGHIHVGGFLTPEITQKQRWEKSLRLARLLDKYVGVYSLLWDLDDERRKIYGLAGSLRLKDYGIEYRSLSNAWLFNRKVTKFVYNATSTAVEALERGEDVESELYRKLIDTGDRSNSFFDRSQTAAMVRAML